MSNTYQIYLISDSTGETLDRVFLAIKAQFKNIKYDVKSYFFTRTENQVSKIMEEAKKNDNAIILYTIVDTSLAKFLANKGDEKKIPCFSVLGNLIMNFSKLLNQKASHVPSGQHALNEEYYERIEAIQFTMNHDDGNFVEELDRSDLILLGVSRTSKTPTSIYLANKGFKTSNIPLVNEHSIPESLKKNPRMACVVGLTTEAERLVDIRKNRMNSLKETENTSYTNLKKIEKEIGRQENEKWHERIIDIDILFFGDTILSTEHLKIPHPHCHERMFVLVPLMEIAGDLIHPILNLPIEDLYMNCEDPLEVILMEEEE